MQTTVFAYEVLDPQTGRWLRSDHCATEEHIASLSNARKVEGSEHHVKTTRLDSQGEIIADYFAGD